MEKYRVGIPEVHYSYIDVEAEDKDDAKEKANKLLAKGVDDLTPEYSHTQDIDEWWVEEL